MRFPPTLETLTRPWLSAESRVVKARLGDDAHRRAPSTCVARASAVARSADLATRPSAGPLRDSTDRCGCHHVAQWDIFFPGSPSPISLADIRLRRRPGPGGAVREIRFGSDLTWAILSGCRNFGKPLMHLAGISAESRPNSQPQRQIKKSEIIFSLKFSGGLRVVLGVRDQTDRHSKVAPTRAEQAVRSSGGGRN